MAPLGRLPWPLAIGLLLSLGLPVRAAAQRSNKRAVKLDDQKRIGDANEVVYPAISCSVGIAPVVVKRLQYGAVSAVAPTLQYE